MNVLMLSLKSISPEKNDKKNIINLIIVCIWMFPICNKFNNYDKIYNAIIRLKIYVKISALKVFKINK